MGHNAAIMGIVERQASAWKSRRRLGAALAAGLAGLVLGGGFGWSIMTDAGDGEDPVRAVPSPCNLVDPALLDRLLPEARITAAGLPDVPQTRRSTAYCWFRGAAESESGRRLRIEVELRRYAKRRVDTIKGEGTRYVTYSGAQEARKAFEEYRKPGPRDACTPRPVAGIGERALACSGTEYHRPIHKVIANRGDLLLEVSAESFPAGREREIQRLAAGALAAVR